VVVPQHLLKRPDVAALFKQVRRKGIGASLPDFSLGGPFSAHKTIGNDTLHRLTHACPKMLDYLFRNRHILLSARHYGRLWSHVKREVTPAGLRNGAGVGGAGGGRVARSEGEGRRRDGGASPGGAGSVRGGPGYVGERKKLERDLLRMAQEVSSLIRIAWAALRSQWCGAMTNCVKDRAS